jgi:hypothetical protein
VSVDPPGGNGTTRLIGRDGNVWARDSPVAATSARAIHRILIM